MSPALQAALARVVPSYMQAVNAERERQVVMAVLEALTGVLRGCGPLALQPPGRLAELCTMLKTVLQRKVSGAGGRWGEERAQPQAWIVIGYGSSFPSLPSMERGRGRRAQAELNCLPADSLSGH